MKGRPLLPTLRTKKRYVKYEIISERPVKGVFKSIKDSYRIMFGEYGLGRSGLMHVKKNVLKINNKYLDNLRVALAAVRSIDGQRVIIDTKKTSGILKKTEG